MTRASEPEEQVRYTVLSVRVIVAWAVGVVLAGVAVAVWLLVAYTGGNTESNRVQLDAIRTAGTIVVGTGGAAALLLAARRQRSAEIALRQKDRDQADVARAYALQERLAEQDRAHQLRVAAATEADAEARRITDLYTKAVEQLGSDKAPVRLGGCYALERLAQENPGQRQTIVNVVSAYLRMPGATDAQEHEVRLTAQRLLRTHLRPGQDRENPAATFWPGIDLDLTDAVLTGFDLSDCVVRTADFTRATMTGATLFRDCRFDDAATFTGTRFEGPVTFVGAEWGTDCTFAGASFDGAATFHAARFAYVVFDSASFTATAEFEQVTFGGAATFDTTRFAAGAYFRRAAFEGVAVFQRTQFGGASSFRAARFPDSCSFRTARFDDYVSFGGTQFGVNVVFDKARFAADANFGESVFPGGASFHGSVFDRGVPPNLAKWAAQAEER